MSETIRNYHKKFDEKTKKLKEINTEIQNCLDECCNLEKRGNFNDEYIEFREKLSKNVKESEEISKSISDILDKIESAYKELNEKNHC